MKKKQGCLIVFDGLDGTGKQTQTERLAKYFEENDIKYKTIAFPAYETPSGELVRQYLNGDIVLSDCHDNDEGLEKFRKSFLYVVDRCINMTKKDEEGKCLLDYYNEGYVIICDRYVSSNFLYMTTETDIHEFRLYVSVMEMIEYTLCGLPRPNMSFFLEMPPEKSLECIDKRNNTKDINENLQKLTKVFNSLQRYKSECERDKKECYFINCISEEGYIRSIEDIHNEIKNIFKQNNDDLL